MPWPALPARFVVVAAWHSLLLLPVAAACCCCLLLKSNARLTLLQVFRNYFVNIESMADAGAGQVTPEHQINGLAQAHAELLFMQPPAPAPQLASFWNIRNGYCMPQSLEQLQAVNHLLDPDQPGGADRRRRFMNSITFGVHWDTQVVDSSVAYRQPDPLERCHKVAQIFCSALPVAYNKHITTDKQDWQHFATAVLQAAYEATFAAAAQLSKERGNLRVMLFLTEVGGGAMPEPFSTQLAAEHFTQKYVLLLRSKTFRSVCASLQRNPPFLRRVWQRPSVDPCCHSSCARKVLGMAHRRPADLVSVRAGLCGSTCRKEETRL